MAAAARRPLVAGNWKMNGLRSSAAELQQIVAGTRNPRIDILVCPPATLIASLAAVAKGSPVAIGGQDCHADAAGAHTGDIAAEMLKDAGASAVIVGHSERRIDHGETDVQVQAKTLAAWRAGLLAIVCVGETRQERDAGATLPRIERQLSDSLPDPCTGALVIAYEPVWAIGSGLTPTSADIAQAHDFIRQRLVARSGRAGEEVCILYGGSVKPSNAKELLRIENVDGALVGGASLKAEEFLAIADVYQ